MVHRAVKAAVVASILLAGYVTVPARAHADVPEQVTAAVQEAVNDLIGNEIDSSYVFTTHRWTSPPLPADCPDSVATRVDIVGFSLCAPADPWAAPTTAPERGENAYGCVNAAEVSMNVIPPGFRANVEITLPYLFVEFRTARETPDIGDSTAVMGRGYLVADAVVSMQCDLLNVEGCMRLAPSAPSAAVSIETRALERRGDPCLSVTFADEASRAQAQRDLEVHMGNALRDLMLARMDVVNEALCGPAVKTPPIWAPVRPRSGSGG